MRSFEYTITDEVGLHARPAGELVSMARSCQSEIRVAKAENEVMATKLMALMGLGIRKGDTIKVTVRGADEDRAAAMLEEFFRTHL